MMLLASLRRRLLSICAMVCALAWSVDARADATKSKQRYDEAMAAGNAGDLPRAVTLFQEALRADPRNFLAAFDLGGAFEAQGDKDGAVANYRRAVELRPDFAEAEKQLATLELLDLHEYDHAIRHFRAALTTAKPYVDARFPLPRTRGESLLNLAIAYAQKNQYGVAKGIGESLLADPTVQRDDATSTRITMLVARADEDLAPALKRTHGAELDAIRKLLHGGQPALALPKYQAFERAHPASQLTAIEQWDLAEGTGLAFAMTGKGAQTAEPFGRARDAALHLPYPKLAETTFNLACALAESDKVDDALTALDELFWLEAITRYDPASRGKPRYHDKVQTDASLAKVRASPKLKPLLAHYGF